MGNRLILISHRGNLLGPNKDTENTIESITYALQLKFHCEIDIWEENGSLYLGHDKPENKVSESFLRINRNELWCHAKNTKALEILLDMGMHCFWHESDKFTLTSEGLVWCFPSKEIYKDGIIVMPELNELTKKDLDGCHGVCSDYIGNYR